MTPQTGAHQATLCLWDFPGKNIGVGCHFLLQSISVLIYKKISLKELAHMVVGLEMSRAGWEARKSGKSCCCSLKAEFLILQETSSLLSRPSRGGLVRWWWWHDGGRGIMMVMVMIWYWWNDDGMMKCVCACLLSHFHCIWLSAPPGLQPTGSSVHEILQARALEWVALPSSRASAQHRDHTYVSFSSYRWVLYH